MSLHRPSDPTAAHPGASAQHAEQAEPMDLLAPLYREQTLAPEGGEAPPLLLWIVIFGVVLFGTYYLGAFVGDFTPYPWLQHPEAAAVQPAAASAEADVDGEAVYSSRCASCHQADGSGVAGAFPPLDGARWVTDDKGTAIRIVLHGLAGEVEVQGETYNGSMPAWGGPLTDAEIAAVLTFVRQAWSNDAPEIATDEVAAVRAATEDRSQPWTADELDDPANQGLPTEAEAPPAE